MRFATLRLDGREQSAVLVHGDRWTPLDVVDNRLGGDLLALIEMGWPQEALAEVAEEASALSAGHLVADSEARFAPPYRRPRKIWGIGLNYSEHAADLGEEVPPEPASFIKGDHTIIGPDDPVVLPPESGVVTTEAELAIIMGSEVVSIERSAAASAVFGVTAALDQTAETILRRNPRYLTRSKNFATFFSFGPEVVTLDEFLEGREIEDVSVATVIDGEERRVNTVANMTHGPWDLIAGHSHLMPWFPGDVLSTGTPGAVPLEGGEMAEARVDGLRPLRNPVVATR